MISFYTDSGKFIDSIENGQFSVGDDIEIDYSKDYRRFDGTQPKKIKGKIIKISHSVRFITNGMKSVYTNIFISLYKGYDRLR